MITTIIFDLGEVILKGFMAVEEHLEKVLDLSPDDINNKIHGPEFTLLLEGKLTEDEFWRTIIRRNKWDIDVIHFQNAIRKNFVEIEGTREIVERLKKKGYKLGLLSDHSREWIEHCEKEFDFHKLFHSTQYSFEVKCCTTDKRTFEAILKKLNEKAENSLFIDDNNENIETAQSVGLNTIQFKNAIQLKKDLASLSIED